MDQLFKGAVDAVDGVRSYVIISPDRAEVLAFLKKYDHEGSTLVVDVLDANRKCVGTYNDEAAYRFLSSV